MPGNASTSGVSGAAIEAGRAVVRFIADDSPLRRGMQVIAVDLKTWGSRISNLGRSMALAGAAGASLFIKPIQEAARVEQLMQRFSAVFANYADSAGKFADNLARRVNQSRLTIRDQLAQYQAYLKGIGFDPKVATQMSQSLVQLTQDWIAFDDTIVNGQEAMDLFLSALSGEVRPARRMGADLRVASMDAEMLAKGIKNASVKMTEMERVSWRFRTVTTALARSGVIGQAMREVNTAAAMIRGFRAAVTDAFVATGNLLLPTFTRMTQRVTESVRWFEKLQATGKSIVPQFAEMTIKVTLLGAAFFTLGKAIELVGRATAAIKLLSGLKWIAGNTVASAVTLVGVGIAAIGTAVVAQAEGWEHFKDVVKETFKSLVMGYKESFKFLMTGDLARALDNIYLHIDKAFFLVAARFDSISLIVRGIHAIWEKVNKTLQFTINLGTAIKNVFAAASRLVALAIPDKWLASNRDWAESNLAEIEKKIAALSGEPAATAREQRNLGVDLRAGQLDAVAKERVRKQAGAFSEMISRWPEFDEKHWEIADEMAKVAEDWPVLDKHLRDATYSANLMLAAMMGNQQAAHRFGLDLSDAALNAELLQRGLQYTTKEMKEGEKVMLRWEMLRMAAANRPAPGLPEEQVRKRAEAAIALSQQVMDRLEQTRINRVVGAWARQRGGYLALTWLESLKHQAVREFYMLESLAKLQTGRAKIWSKEWIQAQIADRLEKSKETGWLSVLDNFFWRMNLPVNDRRSFWSTRAGFGAGAMTAGVFGIGESLDVEKKQLTTLDNIKLLLSDIGERDGAIVARLF